MNKLTLLAPGTRVKVTGQNIAGRIDAIHVYNETLNVQYTIMYWACGERKTVTLDDDEVEVDPEFQHYNLSIVFHTLKKE